MMRNWVLCLGLPLLLACNPSADEQQAPDQAGSTASLIEHEHERVLAVVNGEVVTEPMLAMHALRRSGMDLDELSPDDWETLLLELVELTLISQNAQQQELDQDPMVRARIENMQRALMAQAALQDLRTEPVTESELDAVYEARYAGRTSTEYHARHILVEDAAHARELIRRLDDGADFKELAQLHSTGPGAADGGDLGWFTPEQMVPPFGRAAAELSVGEHSREPVETQFGWHVIRLEDTREQQPPSRDVLRDELEQQVFRQRMEQYVKRLREDAEVKLYRQAAED